MQHNNSQYPAGHLRQLRIYGLGGSGKPPRRRPIPGPAHQCSYCGQTIWYYRSQFRDVETGVPHRCRPIAEVRGLPSEMLAELVEAAQAGSLTKPKTDPPAVRPVPKPRPEPRRAARRRVVEV